MACGYAKFTDRLGVCLATSGPGGIHLLNGLYDAKLDGAPVLAVTGMQFHDLVSTHTQQDVELDKLFADVCVYNARIMGPAHVQNVASLACRTALARRGVAHVMMPVDQQSLAACGPSATSRATSPGGRVVPGRFLPRRSCSWRQPCSPPASPLRSWRAPEQSGRQRS